MNSKEKNMRKKRFLLYVVMDMSESMSWKDETGKAKIQTAMEILPSIIEAAKRSSTVSSALRVSVLGFDQVTTELFAPQTDVEKHDIRSLTQWWNGKKEEIFKSCSGQTYFSVMFNKLNTIIRRDQSKYDSKDYELYRPVVYLLTDGKPEGACETNEAINNALRVLRSEEGDRKAPVILSIGIGDDVVRANIEEYAAGRVTKQWKFDKEKGKEIPEYFDGEYQRGNKDMAFMFRGNNISFKLSRLNRAVLDSIVKSIQKIENKISVAEPDFAGGMNALFDDDERI